MPAITAILLAVLTVISIALLAVPPEAISEQASTDQTTAPTIQYSRADRRDIAAGKATADSGADATKDTETRSPGSTIAGGGPFTFPLDVPEGSTAYGIDVSHHNIQTNSGKHVIKWPDVVQSGVGYVYIKASEGHTLRDSEFDANWKGASEVNLSRGAYHFLSALVDPKVQAEFFLSVYAEDLRNDTDRPPAVDVEWDYTKDQDKVDRWEQQSSAQIVAIVDTWVKAVASATGKTPVIYTNRSWWDARVGTAGDALLASYPVWISDFTAAPGGEAPARTLSDGSTTALWQFTDQGVVPGVTGPVDVSYVVPPPG